MSLGMNAAWRSMQPNKKKCARCTLYYPERLHKCPHCVNLDETELQKLIDKHTKQLEDNAQLGRIFTIGAAIMLVLLLLSFA